VYCDLDEGTFEFYDPLGEDIEAEKIYGPFNEYFEETEDELLKFKYS